MKQYVCIDIGGTEIKYGVLDENELFLTKDKMPTEAFRGGPSLLEKAVGIVREYHVPVIMDVSIGHLPPSMPVICGSLAEAVVHENKLTLEMRLR